MAVAAFLLPAGWLCCLPVARLRSIAGSEAKLNAKSRLGQKLGYIARHWDGLQTFLTDGRVEIDSNKVENLIRPIALNQQECTLCWS